jgi:hypothetical protein
MHHCIRHQPGGRPSQGPLRERRIGRGVAAMKESLQATMVLLLVLPPLCGCAGYYHRERPYGYGGSGCAPGSESAACRVRLDLGPVAYSVWDDGTLAVGIPIVNSGNHAAADVKVSAVTLGSGKLVLPAALPSPLGEIVPLRRAVLQTRFGSLAVPGAYTLTVSGFYTDRGSTRPFTAAVGLTVTRPSPGPILTATAIVQKHLTSGIPTKPSPIRREYEDNNRLGPPAPTGPVLAPFVVKPTHTGPVKAPSPGMSVNFIRDTGTGQPTGVPPDPSTAVASIKGVVLGTANTYLLFSKDDGQTFAEVDPTTIFPQSDGGLCCDQVVIYDRDVDLFFWLLQYWNPSPPAGSPAGTPGGPNRLRVAFSHPADLLANVNSWAWFDLTQATLNSGGGLDYPDLAVTRHFLYVSVDGADATGKSGGLVVARMPLADITGGSGSVGVRYLGPNQTGEAAKADASRLTQNSPDAMYWAGHVDTSHLEVFHWADDSNSVDPHVAPVNTWCNGDFTTLAPDGQQWLDNFHAAGTGAVIAATHQPAVSDAAHGEVWLGWTAARDDAGCTQGRPQPYVKIVRIDDTTLDSVGEYHIWNTPYAFAYPSLGTASTGEIGVSVAFGGPSDFGSTTVGYLGDYVVYYVEASDLTLTFPLKNADGTPMLDGNGNPVLRTRFGDMFAVRDSGPEGTLLSSEGYAYKFVDKAQSTNCAVAPGCTYRIHYEQWGRNPKP